MVGSIMKKQQRRGMTLVEISVALALMSMLMVAIVGVLRQVDRQLKVLDSGQPVNLDWPIFRIVERDLMVASSIALKENALLLRGSFEVAGRRETTDQLQYRIVPWIDNQTALVRQAGQRAELVSIGVELFVAERLDSSFVPQPLSPTWTNIARGYRLLLWRDGASEPTFKDAVLR
ncbi:MAG: prepilin-type N-terminal cleavage/methylation domain-containing protein [Planctomycetota bacterium]